MNYTKLPKSLLMALAAPVLLALAVPSPRLLAQSQSETKINLMAEALRARDSGDLEKAKANLEQLIALAPDDPIIRRQLDQVNAAIAQGGSRQVEVAEPVELALPGARPSRRGVRAAEAAEIATPEPVVIDEATLLAQEEEARLNQLLADVADQRREARSLARANNYPAALSTLETAARILPNNTLTQRTLADLDKDRSEILLAQSQYLLRQGDIEGARASLEAYEQAQASSARTAQAQAARISRVEQNPPLLNIEEINPAFSQEQAEIAGLIARGRSQYLAADIDGAQITFRRIETQDPTNPTAKYFLRRIADDRARIGVLNREKTRAQMLEEVAVSWQRAGLYQEGPATDTRQTVTSPLLAKMESIVMPPVSFDGDLRSVINTLNLIAVDADNASSGPRGVNLVLRDTEGRNPNVNITLRDLNLRRILETICEITNYQYEAREDIVVIFPGSASVLLPTEFFPISQNALGRITGGGSGGGASAPAVNDPFAPAPAPTGGGGGGGGGGQSEVIRNFFQRAGVDFDGTPGSSLVFDGAIAIVQQTSRNQERIRNILSRYGDVRQVEIESKFMEVREGALDELGVQWNATSGGGKATFTTSNVTRPLAGAFGGGGTGVGPSLPGVTDIGAAAGAVYAISGGSIGEFNVNATIRALQQKSGTDLLSSPKVTVMNEVTATIRVGQELRYPTRYTQPQPGSGGSGTGTTVNLPTPSIPEEFESRDVGVVLNVTPTIDDDDYTILLRLNPIITEFEGFVNFGSSLEDPATGRVILDYPQLQPIFAVREITTQVTVWDGATVIMGGLTREDVRRVNDRVPVIGSIPLLGRAFQSRGEATEKRNLLIFVTANLVSPGGSPKNQTMRGVQPSSIFQNPTLVTPAGSEARGREAR